MSINENAPAKVAISLKCMDAWVKLPKAVQKKTIVFISKFQKNPLSPGLNYETIKGAVDKRYRSVRIDKSYRGIVIQSCDKNNVFLLLWVDKHDDAYIWAQRHKCMVDPETGTLQIYDTYLQDPILYDASLSDSDADLYNRSDNLHQSVKFSKRPQTIKFSERSQIIEKTPDLKNQKSVMSRLSSALMRFFKAKPSSPREVLPKPSDDFFSTTRKQMNSINTQLQEVDVDDIGSALKRAGSKQSFWIIENERELQQILSSTIYPKDR